MAQEHDGVGEAAWQRGRRRSRGGSDAARELGGRRRGRARTRRVAGAAARGGMRASKRVAPSSWWFCGAGKKLPRVKPASPGILKFSWASVVSAFSAAGAVSQVWHLASACVVYSVRYTSTRSAGPLGRNCLNSTFALKYPSTSSMMSSPAARAQGRDASLPFRGRERPAHGARAEPQVCRRAGQQVPAGAMSRTVLLDGRRPLEGGLDRQHAAAADHLHGLVVQRRVVHLGHAPQSTHTREHGAVGDSSARGREALGS